MPAAGYAGNTTAGPGLSGVHGLSGCMAVRPVRPPGRGRDPDRTRRADGVTGNSVTGMNHERGVRNAAVTHYGEVPPGEGGVPVSCVGPLTSTPKQPTAGREVPSLRLRALVWQVHGSRSRLRLDLRVEHGEVAVVATDPGAATALADVLLGLARPLSGRVHHRGHDVTAEPPGRRGIALVPVGGGLLPHLTVERNVAYGGDRAHAADRIRDLQLEGIRGLRPHELSPAQRLRVAVARALCLERDPVAIVFEHRAGGPSYRPAADAARGCGAAVLVLSDTPSEEPPGGALRPEVHGDAT